MKHHPVQCNRNQLSPSARKCSDSDPLISCILYDEAFSAGVADERARVVAILDEEIAYKRSIELTEHGQGGLVALHNKRNEIIDGLWPRASAQAVAEKEK